MYSEFCNDILHPKLNIKQDKIDYTIKRINASDTITQKIGINSKGFVNLHNGACDSYKNCKKISLGVLSSVTKGFGTTYFPPLSQKATTTRWLFEYTFPIIHQNILEYASSNTRTYQNDILSYFSETDVGREILCATVKNVLTGTRYSAKITKALTSFKFNISCLDVLEAKDKSLMSLGMTKTFVTSLQNSTNSGGRDFYDMFVGPDKLARYNSFFNQAIEEVLGIKIVNDNDCTFVKWHNIKKLVKEWD